MKKLLTRAYVGKDLILLKNLLHIKSIARKSINNKEFDYSDITNVLFFNIKPLFIVKPFQDFNHLTLRNISFPLYLSLSLKSQEIYDTLEKSVSVDIFKILLKLPPWILGRIVEHYKKGVDLWASYITDNLKEYCKTSESRLYWSNLQYFGTDKIFNGEITTEKMLWVYFNRNIEKEDKIDFVLKLRESLLPWFNNELWQKIEEKKDNTRENVMYEEIKEKILFNSQIDSNDLDIIK